MRFNSCQKVTRCPWMHQRRFVPWWHPSEVSAFDGIWNLWFFFFSTLINGYFPCYWHSATRPSTWNTSIATIRSTALICLFPWTSVRIDWIIVALIVNPMLLLCCFLSFPNLQLSYYLSFMFRVWKISSPSSSQDIKLYVHMNC